MARRTTAVFPSLSGHEGMSNLHTDAVHPPFSAAYVLHWREKETAYTMVVQYLHHTTRNAPGLYKSLCMVLRREFAPELGNSSFPDSEYRLMAMNQKTPIYHAI
jgi:hypothetical protein